MSILKFQDREFSTKSELFKHLRDNHDRILEQKKAVLKYTDAVEVGSFTLDQVKSDTTKELATFNWMKDGYVYPVINTTNYLDSHGDVHLDAIWNRSVSNKNGKIMWDSNHALKIGSEVAFPNDVNIILKNVKFSDLGYDSSKNTTALIFEVKKENVVLDAIKNRIEKGVPTQHSVRMRYVKIEFAMNSDAEEDEIYLARYNKYISLIANQEKAAEQGYFWAVLEAEIVAEGSSVVNGSNDITPMLIGKNIDPSKDTQSVDPPKGTQPKTKPVKSNGLNSFLNNL